MRQPGSRRLLKLAALAIAAIPLAVWAHGNDPEFIKCYAVFLGHPIHPMLVTFPIGLFTTSLVFDAIYAARRDPFWHRASYYLIWGGVIGGVAAAIAGFSDYFIAIPVTSHAHQVATTHWILNTAVLGLFGLSLALRTKADTSAGRPFKQALLLSIVGVAIMMTSAWYGGHLVYEHHVGVSPVVHEHDESPPPHPGMPSHSSPHQHTKHEPHQELDVGDTMATNTPAQAIANRQFGRFVCDSCIRGPYPV